LIENWRTPEPIDFLLGRGVGHDQEMTPIDIENSGQGHGDI